jgi:hypothetical protein
VRGGPIKGWSGSWACVPAAGVESSAGTVACGGNGSGTTAPRDTGSGGEVSRKEGEARSRAGVRARVLVRGVDPRCRGAAGGEGNRGGGSRALEGRRRGKTGADRWDQVVRERERKRALGAGPGRLSAREKGEREGKELGLGGWAGMAHAGGEKGGRGPQGQLGPGRRGRRGSPRERERERGFWAGCWALSFSSSFLFFSTLQLFKQFHLNSNKFEFKPYTLNTNKTMLQHECTNKLIL